MRVYLDLCCFNRPYDDQSQDRIRLETEAKLVLQDLVSRRRVELLWSYVLDYENSLSPFQDRSVAISNWRNMATERILASDGVLDRARELQGFGINVHDALHIACAIVGRAEIFVTTDDRLIRKLRNAGQMFALLPVEALAKVEGWYED